MFNACVCIYVYEMQARIQCLKRHMTRTAKHNVYQSTDRHSHTNTAQLHVTYMSKFSCFSHLPWQLYVLLRRPNLTLTQWELSKKTETARWILSMAYTAEPVRRTNRQTETVTLEAHTPTYICTHIQRETENTMRHATMSRKARQIHFAYTFELNMFISVNGFRFVYTIVCVPC